MATFGQNLNDAVRSLLNRVGTGMNRVVGAVRGVSGVGNTGQAGEQVGSWRDQMTARRQARLNDLAARRETRQTARNNWLAGESPVPYTQPVLTGDNYTPPKERVVSPEEFFAAGVRPETWGFGTPRYVETPSGKYWRLHPNESGTGFSFVEVGAPIYSTQGHAVPENYLRELKDRITTASSGPGGFGLSRLLAGEIDRVLSGQRSGVAEEGNLYYLSPRLFNQLQRASETVGYDWGGAEEWWRRGPGQWFGTPNDIPGTLLFGPDKTWEDWSRLAGFNSDLAKFLASQGITPGPDYSGPWTETGGYNLGVDNPALSDLLGLLGQYMQVTPLGTSAAFDPAILSQILAATGRGGEVWTGSAGREGEYLQNIQPMVSLPMWY